MTEHRDPVVGGALRRLDVPDHAPHFWERLDTDLRTGPAAGDATPGGDTVPAEDGVAEVIQLDSARESRRFRPGRLPAVAAVAAIALALAVGLPAAQQVADRDRQVDSADELDGPAPDAALPAPETTPAPTPDTTVADTTPPASDPAETMLAAEQLAGEWLSLIRAGDAEAAYAVLDDWSRGAMSFAAWQEEATALAEGAGAFAGPTTSSTATLVEQPDGEPVRVVTFTGEVEREGLVEFASYAVAVTGDGDDLAIRYAPEGPMLTLDTEMMTGTTLTSPLPLLVSTTADLWVSYAGRTPEVLDQDGQASIELDVTVAGGGGTHIVTLVGFERGGITVRAYPVLLP